MVTLKIRFCWITAHDDRTEHAVSDDAYRGSVVGALCGVEFLPAAMDIGPARRCPRCTAYLRARTTLRDADARLAPARRPAWFPRCRRGRHAA